jgi:drug/metabolite transporter (DMT)-like permease
MRRTDSAWEELEMVGVVPALLAAVGFAMFQIVNRRALAGVDVYRGTATLLAVGSVVLGGIAFASGDAPLLAAAPIAAIAYCAAAGFVHFFCGWTLLGLSQMRLGVARTGVVIGTVPLFGAVIAAVFLDEELSPIAVAGLVLVVAGVGVVISARSAPVVGSVGRPAVGVAAGLATALCWSVSPVLIRQGLADLPSPVMGAAIGAAACAAVYGLAIVLTRRRAQARPVTAATGKLLLLAGALVALSIWMQWTAFDLAPVAVVLSLLQLTPPSVVLLASWLSPEAGRIAGRVWVGSGVTAAGSLVLILGG